MPFSSERIFKLWDYNVSHRQLLIRSPATPELAGNIDLVFWQVTYVAIPTQMSGVAIDLAFDSERAQAMPTLGEDLSANLYCITTAGRRHLLAASGFKALQNELDIFDSTLVYFAIDRPPEWYGKVLAQL